MRLFPVSSLILCIFLISCVAQNLFQQNSEQLTKILKIRYKNDDRKVEKMFKKLIERTTDENSKNGFARGSFTDKALLKFFEAKVGGYETWYLRVRDLWDNFKTNAVKWFPHTEVFIDDLIDNFLWHDKINEKKIQQFTGTKEKMEQMIPAYVDRYLENAINASSLLLKANMAQIQDILKKDFNLEGSILESFVVQYETKYKKLSANPRYLFNRTSLKDAVAPNKFEICVASVEAEKPSHLIADSATQLDEMKKYFESEKCAAREICAKNSTGSLAEKLEPYIEWFEKVSNGNEMEGNENIKDEIDLTVYDSIEKNLKQNNYSDVDIKCIIDYMKRSKSVDKIYSSDLHFDKQSLAEKVNPIVLEYKKLYPGVLNW